eukprot:4612268-Pleurochrysis_carterae.AAC.4
MMLMPAKARASVPELPGTAKTKRESVRGREVRRGGSRFGRRGNEKQARLGTSGTRASLQRVQISRRQQPRERQ